MNKDTLVLKDGTIIELEAGASLSALQVVSVDKAALLLIWQQFTPANLAEVQVKNGGGLTVGNYKDLVLVSETSVERPDGDIITTYSLREKTAEEKRFDALEAGQDTQDGAIEDVGAVVSVIAGQLEGGQA